MIQLLLNRRNVQQQRFIQMIHAHVVPERNTNSAAEDLQNKNKKCRAFGQWMSECSVFTHKKN
mgnify:CR=1 FL=1